jgi:signal recognition particle subunit SRP54
MGPLKDIMGMLPGVKNMGMDKIDDKELLHVEAILSSMTPKERKAPKVLNGSRRKRISNGSGTTVQKVNQVLKQFEEMKKMMKQLGKMKNKFKMPKGAKLF